MPHPPSLLQSYRYSRRLSRRSRSSFYRSFSLLPRQKRHAMWALYAFARTTDDLGDCDQPRALRTERLQWWRDTVETNLNCTDLAAAIEFPSRLPSPAAGDDSDRWPIDPQQRAQQILPALRDSARQYEIPTRYLLEIVDGVLADQQKTRFETYEQFEHYCYLAASSVGLCCLHIWGFHGQLPVTAVIDCGLAFQLTNILRDIREDAASGRIYLPRQDYEKHGLNEDDMLHPRPGDRMTCLIREEADRAKELFGSGWQIWNSLHDDGKPIFSMMWRTYRCLLDRISDDPGSVAGGRIDLSLAQKLTLFSQHSFGPSFRRLPVPPAELSFRGR